MSRLEIFKALGDNTRYAIYLELARSDSPLSTADIAEALELHPNTVRPHLDRMRDVGLVESAIESTGVVGRPQHRFRIADNAPSLGLESAAYRTLSRLLAGVATIGRPPADDVAAIGRVQGERAAQEREGNALAALEAELTSLGFDPVTAQDDQHAEVAFTHCPYLDVAESFPELVCQLHRGIVEGVVETKGGAQVERFHTILDPDPCRVALALGSNR